MYKTYTCRSDLSRRQRWLFGSRSGSETTDLELVLDPSEPNGSPIYVPVHACILVSSPMPYLLLFILVSINHLDIYSFTSLLLHSSHKHAIIIRLLDLRVFER